MKPVSEDQVKEEAMEPGRIFLTTNNDKAVRVHSGTEVRVWQVQGDGSIIELKADKTGE